MVSTPIILSFRRRPGSIPAVHTGLRRYNEEGWGAVTRFTGAQSH